MWIHRLKNRSFGKIEHGLGSGTRFAFAKVGLIESTSKVVA
jgi:hypothetical protein